MSTTARLNLPYIAPQQAQKQVTYNEAMQALDTLVQPAVQSRTVTSPPGSPAEGDAYVVPASATGGWAGHDQKLAAFVDGAWTFRPAAAGWLAYVADSAEIVIFHSGTWSTLVTNGGASLAKLGINATADLTNRLAVAADATLLSHDGSSHRVKLNKAAAADTASLLLQTGLSGRAELGLAGDDDFHLKVSATGSSWIEALVIARATGLVSLPAGQLAFPAVQNPSASPNTLDDYEEVSFTPVIAGTTLAGTGTYATQTGGATKVGRQVQFDLTVGISAHTGTGSMQVTGLPYASAVPAACTVRVSSLTFTGFLQAYVSGTSVILESTTSGGVAAAIAMDATCNLMISGAYRT